MGGSRGVKAGPVVAEEEDGEEEDVSVAEEPASMGYGSSSMALAVCVGRSLFQ